jgi:cytochrome b6-f complex iron-sulfur subunit
MSAADAVAAGGAGTTRRGMLAFLGWGTMALVGLQGIVAFLVFFWPRKTSTFGSRISVGQPSDFQLNEVRYFVQGKFYLVRLQEGFMALYQKCPHVGCTVPWRADFQFEGRSGWFRCPCHGSTYDRTGQIVFGPAPRPMDYMRMSSEGGRLFVDTGAIRKRDKWDPSQAFRA